MLGATTVWDKIGGRPAGDTANLSMFARVLNKGGVHLLALDGDMLPADLRTPTMQRLHDRDATKAAGAPARAATGVALASDAPLTLDRYIAAWTETHGTAPNLGMALTGSELIVVVAETPEAVAAWRDWHHAATGWNVLPTVEPPAGGHFYLTLPRGTATPAGVPELVWGEGAGTVRILLRDRYVPIPPATGYVWRGDVRPAPEALLAELQEAGRVAAAHALRDQPAWRTTTP